MLTMRVMDIKRIRMPEHLALNVVRMSYVTSKGRSSVFNMTEKATVEIPLDLNPNVRDCLYTVVVQLESSDG